MPFYINFEEISLAAYELMLFETDLVPSRMILKENIEENFAKIRINGIANLEELFQALKTKQKLPLCSEKWNIDETYLVILIREIKSLRQSPVKLKDFIGFNTEDISKIEKEGIKNALQLYDFVRTPKLRIEFAKKTGVDKQTILKLTHHMDLSRVRWVNHTFAYLIYESGCTTAEQLARSEFEALHEAVNAKNTELGVFKGSIGLHDFEITIAAAKNIPFDVIYDN